MLPATSDLHDNEFVQSNWDRWSQLAILQTLAHQSSSASPTTRSLFPPAARPWRLPADPTKSARLTPHDFRKQLPLNLESILERRSAPALSASLEKIHRLRDIGIPDRPRALPRKAEYQQSRRPATAVTFVPSTCMVSRSSRRTRTHQEELKCAMMPSSSSNVA